MTVASLQAKLVPGTISNAARLDFYKVHWQIERDLPQRLSEVPTISRTRHSLPEISAGREELPDHVFHTSGTTGVPMLRYRSKAEMDAYHAFRTYTRRSSGRGEDTGSGGAERVLFNLVPRDIHGARASEPSHHDLVLDALSVQGVARANYLMTQDDKSLGLRPGAQRTLLGSPDRLVEFTAAYGESFAPSDSQLTDIVSISSALTSRAKGYLEESWGIAPREVFSLSEVVGSAGACSSCSYFHFEPPVLAEVLSVSDDSEADVGELTVTELFPFSQYQPLIRYRTGDLVRRIDCSASTGDLAFQALGRLRESRIFKGGRVLSSRAFNDLLDAQPTLARIDTRSYMRGFGRDLGVGPVAARWEIGRENDALVIRLEAELSASRAWFPHAGHDFAKRLVVEAKSKSDVNFDRIDLVEAERGNLAGSMR